MPHYTSTVAQCVPPVPPAYLQRVIARMSTTIRFIHDRKWMHGDVKPSNIFIDHAGGAWLGDFGSSVTHANLTEYRGGTPAFQCADYGCSEDPLRFDLVGLAVSVLVQLQLLDIGSASSVGWPAAAIFAAIERVEDSSLKGAILGLVNP